MNTTDKKMKKFVVCMEVETEEGNPGKWDWTELVGDDCALISVKEVSLQEGAEK